MLFSGCGFDCGMDTVANTMLSKRSKTGSGLRPILPDRRHKAEHTFLNQICLLSSKSLYAASAALDQWSIAADQFCLGISTAGKAQSLQTLVAIFRKIKHRHTLSILTKDTSLLYNVLN